EERSRDPYPPGRSNFAPSVTVTPELARYRHKLLRVEEEIETLIALAKDWQVMDDGAEQEIRQRLKVLYSRGREIDRFYTNTTDIGYALRVLRSIRNLANHGLRAIEMKISDASRGFIARNAALALRLEELKAEPLLAGAAYSTVAEVLERCCLDAAALFGLEKYAQFQEMSSAIDLRLKQIAELFDFAQGAKWLRRAWPVYSAGESLSENPDYRGLTGAFQRLEDAGRIADVFAQANRCYAALSDELDKAEKALHAEKRKQILEGIDFIVAEAQRTEQLIEEALSTISPESLCLLTKKTEYFLGPVVQFTEERLQQLFLENYHRNHQGILDEDLKQLAEEAQAKARETTRDYINDIGYYRGIILQGPAQIIKEMRTASPRLKKAVGRIKEYAAQAPRIHTNKRLLQRLYDLLDIWEDAFRIYCQAAGKTMLLKFLISSYTATQAQEMVEEYIKQKVGDKIKPSPQDSSGELLERAIRAGEEKQQQEALLKGLLDPQAYAFYARVKQEAEDALEKNADEQAAFELEWARNGILFIKAPPGEKDAVAMVHTLKANLIYSWAVKLINAGRAQIIPFTALQQVINEADITHKFNAGDTVVITDQTVEKVRQSLISAVNKLLVAGVPNPSLCLKSPENTDEGQGGRGARSSDSKGPSKGRIAGILFIIAAATILDSVSPGLKAVSDAGLMMPDVLGWLAQIFHSPPFAYILSGLPLVALAVNRNGGRISWVPDAYFPDDIAAYRKSYRSAGSVFAGEKELNHAIDELLYGNNREVKIKIYEHFLSLAPDVVALKLKDAGRKNAPGEPMISAVEMLIWATDALRKAVYEARRRYLPEKQKYGAFDSYLRAQIIKALDKEIRRKQKQISSLPEFYSFTELREIRDIGISILDSGVGRSQLSNSQILSIMADFEDRLRESGKFQDNEINALLRYIELKPDDPSGLLERNLPRIYQIPEKRFSFLIKKAQELFVSCVYSYERQRYPEEKQLEPTMGEVYRRFAASDVWRVDVRGQVLSVYISSIAGNRNLLRFLAQKICRQYRRKRLDVIDMFPTSSKQSRPKILSIGAGSAPLEAYMQAHWDMDILGVDKIRELLPRAAARKVEVRFGDGEDLKEMFADGSFDAVIIPESIGHMDPLRVSEEAFRLVRPGGIVHIMTHTPGSLLKQEFNYRLDTAEFIILTLEAAGFRQVRNVPEVGRYEKNYIYVVGRKPNQPAAAPQNNPTRTIPENAMQRLLSGSSIVIASDDQEEFEFSLRKIALSGAMFKKAVQIFEVYREEELIAEAHLTLFNDGINAKLKQAYDPSRRIFKGSAIKVNPAYKRRGIGSLLMTLVTDLARDLGYQRFVADSVRPGLADIFYAPQGLHPVNSRMLELDLTKESIPPRKIKSRSAIKAGPISALKRGILSNGKDVISGLLIGLAFALAALMDRLLPGLNKAQCAALISEEILRWLADFI
ncbi:GNAT family N-acetyltransferase, partial [Candidatus Omnitrophota bacterium]